MVSFDGNRSKNRTTLNNILQKKTACAKKCILAFCSRLASYSSGNGEYFFPKIGDMIHQRSNNILSNLFHFSNPREKYIEDNIIYFLDAWRN